MVDTLIPDLLDPKEARRPPMVMKDHSDEFKADAVALYESTPGAAYRSIAAGPLSRRHDRPARRVRRLIAYTTTRGTTCSRGVSIVCPPSGGEFTRRTAL